ncbi:MULTISPECIES: AzlD domain-containing protein [Stenotrophomonas]|uniref:AzlD domain-containing protein n=1 Tax=Stenotrophomonas TaxID=40323 RepID=UPI00076FF692|nr:MULTISPECIES: AzlD domain-containing protein [Stenotrophomonas]AMJ57166.1 branched-chain amino acid transporter AzlD [Stenotrophomonas sp. KCTC 12332]
MRLWAWIVLGCVAAWSIKFAGYLVPVHWLQSPRMNRVAGCLTIGLLASLTAMNTVSAGQGLAFDARIGAVLAAAVALMLRLPFLLVVIVGAAAAALIRLL